MVLRLGVGPIIGDPALAERLVADYKPRYPYADHTLVAAIGALTESREELQAAADAYADAADRWDRFGVIPEQAFALLGQGRCLVGLSRPTEAALVLRRASEIFARLQGAPALDEIDALLHRRPHSVHRAILVNTGRSCESMSPDRRC